MNILIYNCMSRPLRAQAADASCQKQLDAADAPNAVVVGVGKNKAAIVVNGNSNGVVSTGNGGAAIHIPCYDSKHENILSATLMT
eukprot:m.1262662 g.1262662  ORF g.1262662 m.1262662 type:complete len:85 (+) comp24733_c0_seq65:3172-3426(+)